MRLPLLTLFAFGAGVVCAPCFAADMSPGMWEITIETRVPTMPDFTPAPVTLKQCLTTADTMDPSKVLGGVANPGATGCTYTDKGYAGNTFRFSMQCAGSYALQSQGEVTFSADAMSGSITAVANLGGEKTEFSSKVSARRLGGC